MKTRFLLFFALALWLATPAAAWKPATDTAGPLTVTIEDIGEVQALEQPIPVSISLANKGPAAVHGQLRVGVIDRWRVEGENPVAFSVPPGATTSVPVTVVAGRGTYAAHYPIHAYVSFEAEGKPLQAHAVLVCLVSRAAVQQASPPPGGPPPEIALPGRGVLRLDRLGALQVGIAVEGAPVVVKPAGWTGSDAATGANFAPGTAARPDRRPCLVIHPPYRGGVGSVYADAR
ncbi:MAG: hypothetical protein QHJ73_17935, partial [Armatimonadota bacterium]|nr:hypothetical protein [Armatimonadota bacterium]